jgi:hypothetical protein
MSACIILGRIITVYIIYMFWWALQASDNTTGIYEYSRL